jgi:hypothetical protein
VPVQDFLNQRSVNVTVDGSYTLPNWYDPQGKLRTFACRTTRVSPFRMIVEVPVVGKVGDRLTSYFRDFGKFEGRISDTMDRSFLLELEMSRARREKLSDMLVWLEKKQKNPAIKCIRQHARFVPSNPHSTLTLADGSVHPCLVIDVSALRCRGVVTGAAADRHAACGRRVHRPRCPAAAQRHSRQVCREAEFQGAGAPEREGRSNGGCGLFRSGRASHVR